MSWCRRREVKKAVEVGEGITKMVQKTLSLRTNYNTKLKRGYGNI